MPDVMAEPAGLYTREGKELGIASFSYNYEEPTLGVTIAGDKLGADYAGTMALNDTWFFRDDLRFAYGKADYNGSGFQAGLPDWYYEFRGLVSRDFRMHDFVLSPFIGFGYRYLFDDARGMSNTGAAGYRRESNYFYVPLGLTHRMGLQYEAVMSTTLEFDYLLWGEQVSRLSDLVGFNGVAGASDTTNRQNSGYGLRLSMIYEAGDLSFGPFLNYWNIAASEVTSQVMTDAMGSALVFLREPKNKTAEYGMRLAFRF